MSPYKDKNSSRGCVETKTMVVGDGGVCTSGVNCEVVFSLDRINIMFQ